MQDAENAMTDSEKMIEKAKLERSVNLFKKFTSDKARIIRE